MYVCFLSVVNSTLDSLDDTSNQYNNLISSFDAACLMTDNVCTHTNGPIH
jgi:hypothetical protein